ncbi:hypothetical protein M409DRAFT_60568 [Zasmidium cellare ATCC 36951]|uniref:Uncharacterized protein n=1 Tax=Zasmidium cellare ATCC 36951 TaxID=1080233 RepID=A0A6A6BYW6_ZASCE|nr:uncharacterized protein M409DRAFT_60568 [Zasmidium cellare ATCC 36951]KAF2159803.1 hypothetical protein M409DRAFT_60568 [Zasmidium cellare ATCC 36951]
MIDAMQSVGNGVAGVTVSRKRPDVASEGSRSSFSTGLRKAGQYLHCGPRTWLSTQGSSGHTCRAVEMKSRRGAGGVVVIGADSPSLSHSHLASIQLGCSSGLNGQRVVDECDSTRFDPTITEHTPDRSNAVHLEE